MKKWAILTCKEYNPEALIDDDLLFPLLKEKSILAENVIWNNPDINWNEYSVAIIRSTWDYIDNYNEFIRVLELIEASSCKLFNPLSIVKYNSKKTYLRDFQTKNLPIVPTTFLCNPTISEIEKLIINKNKYIIKPAIGAGASGLKIINSTSDLREISLKGEFLFQPLIESIREGELSLIFFNKCFSHALIKVPEKDDIRSQEEFGSTLIPCSSPCKNALEIGEKILSTIKEAVLYARIDLIKDEEGNYRIMEVEMIEPCLYLSLNKNASQNFIREAEKLNLI